MSPLSVPSFNLIGEHIHDLCPKMQGTQKNEDDYEKEKMKK